VAADDWLSEDAAADDCADSWLAGVADPEEAGGPHTDHCPSTQLKELVRTARTVARCIMYCLVAISYARGDARSMARKKVHRRKTFLGFDEVICSFQLGSTNVQVVTVLNVTLMLTAHSNVSFV